MPSPLSSISIRTGARLHLGPLTYHPARGRHFGGIGMMIEHPGVELRMRRAAGRAGDKPRISEQGTGSPPAGCSVRAQELLHQLQDRQQSFFSVQMDVLEGIPPHAGLGSGTQLSLAVLEAFLRLQGNEVSPEDLVRRCERGERSAVGLHGYFQGGFLVDAGHAPDATLGEIACRVDVPPAWRILLLHPEDTTGLHGKSEARAFQTLPPLPESVSGRLCRLTLTDLLPALRTAEFVPFAEALFEYGQLVGEFFTPTQGGVFASPCLRELRARLPGVERTGMAQSSWGPTVALFAETAEHAQQLEEQVQTILSGTSFQSEIVSPRNTGRTVHEDCEAAPERA